MVDTYMVPISQSMQYPFLLLLILMLSRFPFIYVYAYASFKLCPSISHVHYLSCIMLRISTENDNVRNPYIRCGWYSVQLYASYFQCVWPLHSLAGSDIRIIGHHYGGVIISVMASQITSLTVVYSTVYSGVDQRKTQSSVSLAFVRRIHRWPVNSPHKGPVTRKMFPFDDVIMCGPCFTCPA